jgi:hypothetical protein
MPNWCENTVLIMGDTKTITEVKEFLTEGDSKFSFNKVKQCPPELREYSAPQRNEQKAGYLLKKYGAKDWYDWCIENWDTKWDAHDVVLDESTWDDQLLLEYRFETAWAPPIKVIQELSKKYPDLKIHLSFDEPGMGFSGWQLYVGGEETRSEQYDHSFYSIRVHMEPSVDVFEYL